MKNILKRMACLMMISLPILVAVPAQASGMDGWHKGVLIQPQSSTDYSSSSFKQSVSNAAANGVNYVSLIVPLRQSSVNSNDVYRDGNTPTDQSLTDGINYIHSKGMNVSVGMHVNPNDGQWRAMISPSDRSAWFRSYGQQLNHYADIAQSGRVEELVIGTELSSLTIPSYSSQNTPGWTGLIQSARTHFSGLMTYSAQHGGYMSDDQSLGFWSLLDEIGISAYYPMGDSNTSVDQMIQKWAQVDANELGGIARTYNKPVIFVEAGFVSGNNALGDPGSAYGNTGSVNTQLQANAYQALLSYWSNSSYMRGVSFWDWSSNPNAGGQNDTGYTPQNKPAEQIMKTWFTSTTAGSGSGGGTGTTTPAPTAKYTAALKSGSTTTTGSASTVSIDLTSTSAVSNALVDVEIYDPNGQRVAQKYYENQQLAAGTTSYQAGFTPNANGQYTVKVGVFTANWQSNLYWNDAVGLSTAAASTPPPVTTPNPPTTTPPVPTPPTTTPPPVATPTPAANISVWWPSNGGTVSGVQPFKTLVDGMDASQYTMYWQVDSGQLNPMGDNNEGAPHKQADVDLTSWTWKPDGMYVVTFVAKDKSGNVIAQKPVTIHVIH